MYAEWFRHTLGIDFYNVPYKNNIQTLAATASGEVQGTLFALGGASSQARAGKVKILAAISEQRLSAMPNLPTIKEEGVDLVIRNWVGTFARAGMPSDLIERWNRTLSKSIADKTYVQKVLEPLGFEAAPPSGESVEAFAQFLVRDKALYVRIKNEARLKTTE
jgi:tripartite-type tricarboxylate transporter receptor subunit TctC